MTDNNGGIWRNLQGFKCTQAKLSVEVYRSGMLFILYEMCVRAAALRKSLAERESNTMGIFLKFP